MRLLVYNIHKGIGGRDRRYRLERILDVIERENPDLVCLQEVARHTRRARFDDQPKLMCDRLAPSVRLYQMNVHNGHGGYGNLLLSRWEVLEKHHLSLQMRSRKPRGAQVVVVETPEGALRLVNWHLGLAERERHWQVERLLTHHLFRQRDDLPTVIAGDTNDWRNTLCRGQFRLHGYEHVTSPASRHRTFPAYLPVGSLDKIFVRGALRIRHVRIVRSPLARIASDHLPLVIDFHLG